VSEGHHPEVSQYGRNLENPHPTPEGAQPVFRREAYAVDTSKLPPGSVKPDGAVGSTVTPPGHVTVNLGTDAEEAARVLQAAEDRSLRVKFPK
jgi:hypothetical protein